MTTATVDTSTNSGRRLADLADFGDDVEDERTPAPARAREHASAPAREDNTEDQADQAPVEDTASDVEDTAPRRRGPRPAGEHVEGVQRVISNDGLGGLATPTLAEAFAEQEEAITQFRTLWWRVPRAVHAVAYLLVLGTAVLSLKVLARARYLVTAVVIGGGIYLVWSVWGAGA